MVKIAEKKAKRMAMGLMVLALAINLTAVELFSQSPKSALKKRSVKIDKIELVPVKGGNETESVPLNLSYQGYLTDDSGSPINGNVSMIFKIYDASTGGTQLWLWSTTVDVQNGIFHVILPNVPASVFSSGESRWLELTVNNQTLSPRTEITSMAYAYNTYMIGGKPVSDVSPSTGQVLKWDGSQWAPGDDNAGADNDWVISGNNMYSGVSGNVGIGTTNPGRLLSLESDTISPTISFINTGPGGREWWIFSSQDADGAGGGKLVFRDQTANSVRAVIDSTGNVGIGTTNPGAKLEVAGHIWQTGTGQSVFLGVGAGANDYLSTNRNVFIGDSAGYSNTTGSDNTAMGFEALYSNTTGSDNTAMGNYALSSNTTGFDNTAVGLQALHTNTMGYFNTAAGVKALYSNTTGYWNTAMGLQALSSNTTGSYNTAVGVDALRTNTTGYSNTAVGYEAGVYTNGGWNYTGKKSVYIGGYTKAYADGDTNEIVIGYDAMGLGSNTVVLGNDHIVKTALKGNVGIGTTNPGYKLQVGESGDGTSAIANAWNVFSSRRWKTNIKTIENALDKVMKLRGVYFDWKKTGKHDIGMIAEEVGKVIPEVVTYEENGIDAKSLDYARLTALLVEAIKEQQKEIDELKEVIRKLQEK